MTILIKGRGGKNAIYSSPLKHEYLPVQYIGSSGMVQEAKSTGQLSTVRPTDQEIKPLWLLVYKAFHLQNYTATLQYKSKILSERELFGKCLLIGSCLQCQDSPRPGWIFFTQ
jgi:hypothetical protein